MSASPANYITSQSTSDFSSGVTEETNAELITRLASGVSGKTTASRKHVRSFIEETFTDVIHGSVIGFGEPEMTRDRNNIFDISYGGKGDIYVQTDLRPTVQKVTKTAFLLNASNSLWQVSFDRDEFAGVMKIDRVVPENSADQGSLEIASDVRGINTTPSSSDPDAFVPDIQNYT